MGATQVMAPASVRGSSGPRSCFTSPRFVPAFTVEIDLRFDKASETAYTCDGAPECVRINSEYTT